MLPLPGLRCLRFRADTVSPQVPNVAQVKFLLKSGVREPMVRWLSEIAIVEGFGAMIRELPVPPLSSFIREDTAGTALAHLTSGLFEAHARDRSGMDRGRGPSAVWDAARDAALSDPAISPEIYAAIIARRGAGQPAAMFPELGEPVERLIRFMANVLAIEVFAASTFASAGRSCPIPKSPTRPTTPPTWCVSSAPTKRRTSSTCARRSLKSRRARCSRLTASRSPGRKVVNDLAERGIRAIVWTAAQQAGVDGPRSDSQDRQRQGYRRVAARVRRARRHRGRRLRALRGPRAPEAGASATRRLLSRGDFI